MNQQLALGDAADDRDGLMDRVRRFVAPIARDAGAVGSDATVLDVADAVVAAFGDLDAAGGLTKAHLAGAVESLLDGEHFEARLDHMVRTGMLVPVRDKAHQLRYLLSPESATSMLVWERLAREGGIAELASLLDRTADGLRSGVLSADQVRFGLATVRRHFAINADHLAHLVRSAPLGMLLRHRRHHRSADALLERARLLVALLARRHAALTADGDRMVGEALRYSAQVGAFIDRLFREAAASRDFSMLDPEQYHTAAVTSDRDALAAVFARTVFDPPHPWLDPAVLAAALERVRPRPDRRRPPEPAASGDQDRDDPVATARDRARTRRLRRGAAIEDHLDGQDRRDVTSRLKAGPWPATARIVADVLAAHSDPSLPFEVELSEAVIVDPEGPVSWVTAMTIRRTSAAGQPSAAAESESRASRWSEESQ